MIRSTFEELLESAKRVGIPVRHVALGGTGGGLAMLKGRRQLFVDTDAEPEDQLERTIRALATVKEIIKAELRPDVRRLLEQTG